MFMEELKSQVSKIYDIVNIVLENQGEMRKYISGMNERLIVVEKEQKEMRKDISNMQEDISMLKKKTSNIESEMREGFKKVNERIDKTNEKIDKGFMDTSFEFRRINYIFAKMPNNKEISKLNKEFLAQEI